MKILVISQDYPSKEKPYAMSYVHSRNIEYCKGGHDIKVINFSATESYCHENINVFLFSNDLLEWCDVILSHAPNIKNHVRVLKILKNKKIVFFFHGHEVLYQHKDYPKPYKWKKDKISKKFFIQFYDFFKIKTLKFFLKKISNNNNVGFIFVSSWMERQFLKNIDIDIDSLGKKSIIANACNSIFLDSGYAFDADSKLADFITIRPLDDSKYAIDLVVDAANVNPKKNFHIYGKGEYFKYNNKPPNITVIDKFINQKEIPLLLNKYRCALMPTRYDSQGVMVCEMATYGIPVITTNFEVCLEMLKDFKNVILLNEDYFKKNLAHYLDSIPLGSNNLNFDPKRLIQEELNFFDEL